MRSPSVSLDQGLQFIAEECATLRETAVELKRTSERLRLDARRVQDLSRETRELSRELVLECRERWFTESPRLPASARIAG